LVTAQPNGSLQLQGYNTDGSAIAAVNWSISPDLSHYLVGATSQVNQVPNANGVGVLSTLNVAANGGPTFGGFFLGWNDIVTDGTGTHYQVEFAIVQPNKLAADGVTPVSGSTVAHSTFQIADGNPQSVRVGGFGFNGQSFEYLVYGDGTGTHIIEFDPSGNQIADIFDPTSTTFVQATNFGDGRVGITYNEPAGPNNTTQYDTHIYDLRTTGLDITLPTDGIDNFIAGTQFSDVVTGENGVHNTYYYVGLNAQGLGASNTGPSDIFHGGTGQNAWNTVIFVDSRDNYDLTNGGTTITNVDPQQAHAGTLTVDGNVQVLAFAPTQDPAPNPDGSVEATGDTLVLLSPFTNAATIDAGATLELLGSDSGSVTFLASTGTLRLDHSSTFTGQIIGFTGDGTLAGSDQIDLTDIDYNSLKFHVTFDSLNDILTVTDGTDTATLHFTGSYVLGNFKFATDGNGGTIVYDPPVQTPSLDQSPISAPAKSIFVSTSENETFTGISASDNFVFRPGFGHDSIAAFHPGEDVISLDHTLFANINAVLSSAHAVGTDTVIDHDANNTITLKNIVPANLHATDFHLI
jgi:hypothetical protein